MSGVRDGGEDGEDGETRRGKAGAKERGREGWTLKRERRRETGELERSGAFPRTVGPRSGVGCPALISTRSQIKFLFQSCLQKTDRGGGWIMRATFVFFSSGRNKTKKKSVDHTSHLQRTLFFAPFFLIKRDKQGMIH